MCVLVGGVGLAVGGVGGCAGDLSAIDAKIDRTLREKTDRLGGGVPAPQGNWPSRVEAKYAPSLVDKDPATVNPAYSELRYKAADESRDAAARLAAFEEMESNAEARSLTLEGAFKQSHETSREYLNAEEEYILAGIRLLVERHAFDPQLFANLAGSYNHLQTDGRRSMTARLLTTAGVQQQLKSGGEVSASWVWDATENLRASTTGRYTQASQLVLQGNIPLLRGAGYIAEESLIQAERDMVYAARDFESFRRDFLVSLARDYFLLLQGLDSIESQKRQLDSFLDLEKRQRAWNEAGLLPEFEVNLASNNVLQARATLSNLKEAYILALDRFKVRLGLDVRVPLKINQDEFVVLEPDISLERATELALEFRLDLQNRRDRLNDTKRAVANAKNQLLPDLNVGGAVTFPTKPSTVVSEGGSVYEFDDMQFVGTATLSLPLDRESERLNLRAATIREMQARRDFDKFRDELILDVRAKTREIDRARLNLTLAEERVKINQRRQEEQSLKPDEVTTQQQVDTANDLRSAEASRDQAKADLRNAVLDFLLATGQLRVQVDGTFQPLPGMQDEK